MQPLPDPSLLKKGTKSFLLTSSIFLLASMYAPAFAQITDTLHEVHIKRKKLSAIPSSIERYSAGQKVIDIDSGTLQQYKLSNIAQLLADKIPTYIRSYSFNGLSTLNFRGASAAQSQVLWNGIPIQNPSLGVTDVSTIPVVFMNKVSVVYGGASALTGSGNVGGALLLANDEPVFDSSFSRVTAAIGAGSFGQKSYHLGGRYTYRRLYLAASVVNNAATNNYRYTNDSGKEQTLTNSALKSTGVLLQASFKTGLKSALSVNAWLQQYNREIPAALFEPYSVKRQTDRAERYAINWHTQSRTIEYYSKIAYTTERTHYSDEAILMDKRYMSSQIYGEAGLHMNGFGADKVWLFCPVLVSSLQQPDTTKIERQQRLAIVGAYKNYLLKGRVVNAFNLRCEQANGLLQLLPGYNVLVSLVPTISLKASVQRSYRLPTLNELYYFPGGNTSLRSEQGWSYDVGMKWVSGHGRWHWESEVNGYQRNIKDWILWTGGAIWTPHNLASVSSHGVETDNSVTWKRDNWLLQVGISTAYTISVSTASYIPNDGTVGKQLPYTPRYNTRSFVSVTYRHVYIAIHHAYTGYRYTNADESDYLLPYRTVNLSGRYIISEKHQLTVNGQCNNISNSRYTLIAGRPMPGLNWLVGLSGSF